VTANPETADAPAISAGILDNPVWSALTGPHAHLAQTYGQAVRYPVDVSPFAALPTGAGAWDDLAALAGPGALALMTGTETRTPPGWDVTMRLGGVQMVGSGLEAAPDPEALPLGLADVPEMLDLVARTRPGPFLPGTVTLGGYLGIRRAGALVAMAGQRLRTAGWTEISAVCTDEAYRGQGLGARLVKAVAVGIRSRGDIPFLHAASTNTTAIRLYRSIGFEVRRETEFILTRVPAG
jgi:ribosomal protein S18 acetylase RimI-like enzyme